VEDALAGVTHVIKIISAMKELSHPGRAVKLLTVKVRLAADHPTLFHALALFLKSPVVMLLVTHICVT